MSVYLAQGRALVAHSSLGETDLVFAATRPLGDLLDELDVRLDRALDKPWRMHLYLSGHWCPAIGVALPQGIRHTGEAGALVQQVAANEMGLAFEGGPALHVALSPGWVAGGQLTAGVLLAPVRDLLLAWAARHRGRMQSMRPMWSLATRVEAVRSRQVRAVRFHEPGLQTLIDADAPRLPHMGALLTGPADGVSPEVHDPSSCVAIGFDIQSSAGAAATAHPRGPWPERWRCLP